MKNIGFSICLSLISVFAFSQWTWQNPLPQGNDLKSIFFADANTGYEVGVWGIIIKTTDGGSSWSVLPSGKTNTFYSVWFTDANTGYVAGDYGTILTTNDGGITFIEKKPAPKTTFNIYPNPANNNITISDNRNLPGETIIQVFKITGEQVIPRKFQDQPKIMIDISSLTSGIYIVKMQTKAGIEARKLVIQ